MRETVYRILVGLVMGTIEQTKEALLLDPEKDASYKAVGHLITAMQAVEELIKQRELELAQKIIGLIDDLHLSADSSHDHEYKGIKNNIRAHFEREYGYDPAANYPVEYRFRANADQPEQKEAA